ncbi:hypothetical protein Hanom_Chr04g00304311 [Helianthus anomalus]
MLPMCESKCTIDQKEVSSCPYLGKDYERVVLFDGPSKRIQVLNTSRLAHTFRENPIICKDWIKDFWNNASTKKGDTVIKSKVQNKGVSISEQDIREVLLFGDADDPVDYTKEKVMEVLNKMSYEGSYPPTTKKLWEKNGIDTLTIKQTSGVVSLVDGWKFNYSNCVFDDMMANVKTLNEKYWFKFPRFLQMILETKYSMLQPTITKEQQALVNAIVADEHGVEIIEAPPGSIEPVENFDLTGVESEEHEADDRMIDDTEVSENVG